MDTNNYEITNAEQKVFNSFNMRFFNNELPMPVFKIGNRNTRYTKVYEDQILKQGSNICYYMTVPHHAIVNDIYNFAICILEGMVIEYNIISTKRLNSNKAMYRNTKFKSFIEDVCGLHCTECHSNGKKQTTYGYRIDNDNTFKALCDEYGFEKKWGKSYYERVKSKSRSIKYIDTATQNTIWVSKKHFLICFDSCPEIGEKVEQMFNIKRMLTEDEMNNN